MPKARVILHDVPQDRKSANRDHRLGNVVGNIADARAVTTTENNYFHRISINAADTNYRWKLASQRINSA